MKYFLIIFSIIALSFNFSFAEEKKIKMRSSPKSNNFKKVEINISPDLINIEEIKNLKKNINTASKYAKELDTTLREKKKIKYRGSAKEIYNNYSKSVFYLYNPDMKTMGTGFLVDDVGLVLSNWHVAEKAENLYLWTLPDGGELSEDFLFDKSPYFNSEVVAVNKEQDLALIKVLGLPKSIKSVKLGSNDVISVGDDVYAIGHPISYPWTFSFGMVSQVRNNFTWNYDTKFEHKADVVQMQTPISEGNSGGPLFSSEGIVIGVNTLGITEGQNLNFAIAVDHVKKFIDDNPDVKNINPITSVIKKKFSDVITQDFNENGVIDTWYIDTNKNGKTDKGFVDDNEDGIVEGILYDVNENGIYEIYAVDTDGDGKEDKSYIDKNEDGKADVISYDYDQDGKPDKVEPYKS